MNFSRRLYDQLAHHIKRGKSILLLGPRQTGKTTLIWHFQADKFIQLMDSATRQRYERDPSVLAEEITAQFVGKMPLIIIDEVQKVPSLLDVAQTLIDAKKAQFILTGSSARKIKRRSDANLLPGRVVSLRLDPILQSEMGGLPPLNELLLFGSLPDICTLSDFKDREIDLFSYVTTYLEEEIRAEALTRNLGAFARFLELAASESGKTVNISKLSQEIGVSQSSIANYYQILEDCLVVEKLLPYTKNARRPKLTRTPKYLFFDMGVRRIAAREGLQPSLETMGHLLEHYVGLELIRECRLAGPGYQVFFWRDPAGPEVDFVLKKDNVLIPIEVKRTANPSLSDLRHLTIFLNEYEDATCGYVVCLVPEPRQLSAQVVALPWQHVSQLFLPSRNH